nr:d-arabinitol 2-dehydrogenase [ribulose-forming] [Quercus suber]POF00893.1 d-arabinitol 2-dehydrogenase [ribulose-forming] [Quercus suber]
MAPSVVDDFKPADSVPESILTEANAPTIPNLFSLREQTVVVTGGGRGLGITLAIAVVEAGGSVVCLDILPEPSTIEWSTVSKLAKRSGTSATYERCDITNESEVEQALAKAAEQGLAHGAPFSGIVHCAGIQQKIPLVDYPVADFRRIMDVNVTGSFLVAKHASRIFIENHIPGSIVLIASMSGQIANRGLKCAAYNTSKSAVHQLCRSMAQEVGEHGIRINTLSPGYIRTAMTDALLANEPEIEKVWMAGALLGRLGAPEDFKAPAIYLLSKGSSFMTGADLRVDGGHCASA